MWWGTPENCSIHGKILKHPGSIKPELKQRNISSLSKNYLLKEQNVYNSTIEVFEISGGSHHTNEGLSCFADFKKIFVIGYGTRYHESTFLNTLGVLWRCILD